MRKTLVAVLLLAAAATTATSNTTERTEHHGDRESHGHHDHVIAAVGTDGATNSRRAGKFSFLFSDAGLIGRWDPCQEILWKMNVEGHTQKRFRQTVKAFRQLRKATGLQFRYGGHTTDEEIATLEPGVVTVSFVPAEEMTENVVGTAGVATPDMAGGRGIGRSDVRIAIGAARDRVLGYLPVLLHELGHVAGLGHSSDRRSVMYAYTNGVGKYNRNDLKGLTKVGAGNGCITAPQPPDVPELPAEPVIPEPPTAS